MDNPSLRTSRIETPNNPQNESGPIPLPLEVVNTILNYLTILDIYNLRLTCRGILRWTQNSSKFQKFLSSKETALYTPKHLRIFLKTDNSLPLSRFKIKTEFFDFNRNLTPFLRRFVPFIRHLSVTDMYCCVSDQEFLFYDTLTSLKILEVQTIDPLARIPRNKKRVRTHSSEDDDSSPPWRVGSFSKTLETFSCELCMNSFYAYDILACCPNLKVMTTPMFGREGSYSGDASDLSEEIQKLTWALKQRQLLNVNGTTLLLHLTCLDQMPWKLRDLNKRIGRDFVEALGTCGVTVMNPNIFLVDLINEHRNELGEESLDKVLKTVDSLRGISSSIKMLELPELVEIDFVLNSDCPDEEGINTCLVDDWSVTPTCDPEFPNLGTIAGRLIGVASPEELVDVEAMLNFLLKPSQPRMNLMEISFRNHVPYVPLTPEHFSEKFPNLRKLSLNIEFFTKADYSRLFLLLGKCTEVRNLKLDSYTPFDDETFIGHNEGGLTSDVPYFSTLKSLKKFTLKFQDIPPSVVCGMTDQIFTGIFNSMPLQHFIIRGCVFSQITVVALEALITGRFGREICELTIEIPRSSRGRQSRMEETYFRLEELAERNSERFHETLEGEYTEEFLDFED